MSSSKLTRQAVEAAPALLGLAAGAGLLWNDFVMLISSSAVAQAACHELNLLEALRFLKRTQARTQDLILY